MSDVRPLFREAFLEGKCRRLTLSRPGPAAGDVQRVQVRPVEVRGESGYQFAFRTATQERHENLWPAAASKRAQELFGHSFLAAHLFTDEADYAITSEQSGRVTVKRSPPSRPAVDRAHNRAKQHLIPEGTPCPFLVEIGVMTAAGKVRADKQHKFRQINRFLEFVEDIVPELPSDGPLHLVDFGCGKSSLTFAVHHLLTAIHGREVEITGLDRNPSVIETCRDAAGRLGCRGLRFEVGDISRHEAATRVDLAISLHACDTATDFALAKAVSWNAGVILAVPCCQHELAPQLQNDDLAPLLRHGILRERFASLVTDALRAEWLEEAGYRTQVLEFIDLEHTPKNLLLRAVRRAQPPDSSRTESAIARMRKALHIETFTLADGIGPSDLKETQRK